MAQISDLCIIKELLNSHKNTSKMNIAYFLSMSGHDGSNSEFDYFAGVVKVSPNGDAKLLCKFYSSQDKNDVLDERDKFLLENKLKVCQYDRSDLHARYLAKAGVQRTTERLCQGGREEVLLY